MGEMVEQNYRQVMALPPSSPNAIFPAELLQMITVGVKAQIGILDLGPYSRIWIRLRRNR